MPTLRLRFCFASLTLAAAILTPAAVAHAQTHATCQVQAHIRLSTPLRAWATAGSFRSDGTPTVKCTGYVGSRLADGHGFFQIRGRWGGGMFDRLAGAGTCRLNTATGWFYGSVPVFLALFSPIDADMGGKLTLRQIGPALTFAGTGYAGNDRVSYTGAGTFTRDSGQACATGVRSGTLSEQIVLRDGGRA
jgi:hypothetical protein